MVTVGIDIGTAAVKVVFAEKSKLLWKETRPSSCQNAKTCGQLFNDGLRALALSEGDIGGVAAAGYGRALSGRAGKMVNEVSANALGAFILSEGKARAVINIGGQDVKIIKITPAGKVADFKMNDKCAAGTGRFFEMAERILGTPLREFGELGLSSQNPLEINSTCAVFAETEIVSLMSEGKSVGDIIAGLNRSIAIRIRSLSDGMGLEGDIYLDGGPAVNKGLLARMSDELDREVKVLPYPQFTVAFGAAAMIGR